MLLSIYTLINIILIYSIPYQAKKYGWDIRYDMSPIGWRFIEFSKLTINFDNKDIAIKYLLIDWKKLLSNEGNSFSIEGLQINSNNNVEFKVSEPMSFDRRVDKNTGEHTLSLVNQLNIDVLCLNNKICLADQSAVSVDLELVWESKNISLKINQLNFLDGFNIQSKKSATPIIKFSKLLVQESSIIFEKHQMSKLNINSKGTECVWLDGDFFAGKAHVKGEYNKKIDKPLSIQFEVEKISNKKRSIFSDNILSSYSGDIFDGHLELKSSHISVGAIEINKTLMQSNWQLWPNPKFSALNIDLNLFDGKLSVHDGTFKIGQNKSNKINFDVKHVSMDSLAKNLGYDELSMSGYLNGTIPIIFSSSGIEVQKGYLTAQQGKLVYDSQLTDQTNDYLKQTFEVLKNYQYTSLEAFADQKSGGDLILTVNLKGKNPDFMNGRAVDLNLTIEEHLPSLIKAIIAHDIQIK